MKRVLIALLYIACLATVALLMSSTPVEGQECPGTCGSAKAAQPASCATCPSKAAPVKQEVLEKEKSCSGSCATCTSKPAAGCQEAPAKAEAKEACTGACDTCESAAKPAAAPQEAAPGPRGGRGKGQRARAGRGQGRQQGAAGQGKGRGAGRQAAGGGRGRGQGRGRQSAQKGCGTCGGGQAATQGGGRGRGRQAASPGRGAGRQVAAQGRGRGRCGQTAGGPGGRGANCGLGAVGVTAPVQKGADVVEEPSPEEALTVEDAAPAKAYVALLQDALRGELYAHAYYQAAAVAFPGARRFQNLARAESRHAKAVGQAVQMLGGTPVTEHGHQLVAPATATDAENEGQKIERQVIERFEVLIRDCPEPAIKTMLEQLQAANYRHLRAMGG